MAPSLVRQMAPSLVRQMAAAAGRPPVLGGSGPGGGMFGGDWPGRRTPALIGSGLIGVRVGRTASHPVGHQQRLADPGEHRPQRLGRNFPHSLADLREAHVCLLPRAGPIAAPW
jgi:hypothetical protein